ncbi:non-oxidative hydroxyarylic acid decarboxylases subunit D, partial [Staphylococcus succinus]
MICPRCDSEKVELLTTAPKDNAWEVYICET